MKLVDIFGGFKLGTIQAKLYFAVGIIVISLLALATTHYHLAKQRALFNDIRQSNRALSDSAHHTQLDLMSIQALEKEFISHDDSSVADMHSIRVNDLLADFDALLAKHSLSPEITGMLTTFKLNAEAYRDSFAEIASLTSAGTFYTEAESQYLLNSPIHRLEGDMHHHPHTGMSETLLRMHGYVKGYTRTLDTQYISQIKIELDQFLQLAGQYISLPEDQAYVHSEANIFLDQLTSLNNSLQASAALRTKLEQDFNLLNQNMEDLLNHLDKEEQTMQSDLNTKESFIGMIFNGILLTKAFIVIPIIILVIISIVSSTRNTAAMLKDIATGESDLNKRLEIKSNDEMGEIAIWFNQIMDKLESLITEIQAIANHLTEVSLQSQAVTQKTNQAIKEQVDEINALAHSVEDMSESIIKVAGNARDSSNMAIKADQDANSGAEVIKGSTASITAIAEKIEEASNTVDKLTESSQSINSVLDIIMGLAEQTNLLALNAAIEAARAGEHGRGFAVVADEVRSLSKRTAQATDEIRGTISSIQKYSTLTSEVMQQSKEQASSNVENARLADESLHDIINAIAEISNINTEIAASSEHHSEIAQQINTSIQGVTGSINQISENTQQATSDRGDLSQMASMLNTLTSQFSKTAKNNNQPQQNETKIATPAQDDGIELF